MVEGLTQEFFDKPETDDTLQNIRKQYLASKKNLHDLMLKQSTQIDNQTASPLRMKPPKLPTSDQRGTTSHSQLPSTSSADSLIILNELRSLKTIVSDQQCQIKRLHNDLQTTKNFNFQLQDKIYQLQDRINYLENDMMNYLGNARPLQSVTAPSTATTHATYRSQAMYPTSIEDNTARLIQISGPK